MPKHQFQTDDEVDRPPPRDKTVGTRIPPDLYEKVEKKARKKRRSLGAILRAFLIVWGDDEYPDPPEMPDENLRARMRKKKTGKE